MMTIPVSRALAVAALAALVPLTGALASAPAAKTHATLRAGSAVKSKASFKHVMGSATFRYTKGDVFITVTTENLPSASSLGKHAYVVYASDGAMTDRVGVLKAHGQMAAVKGEVMMSKVQDLYIYAESSAHTMHPHGIKVLAAMVG